MGLLDTLRANSPNKRMVSRAAEGDISVGDLDQFLGQYLYQQWLQNAMTQYGNEAGVYGNVGLYPKSFLGENFDESSAIKSLPYKSYEESVRANKEAEALAKEQQRLDEAYRQLVLTENSKNQALDRQLTRDVEMGRIGVQEKEIQMQYARIASEERIANAKLKLDEERNKIELRRVGIEKYGVDVTRELGLRREGREDFLANLQKAGMEAELAARPRDYIKLAFLRAGQNMPESLKGLSGGPTVPSFEPSTYTAPQPEVPTIPTNAPPSTPQSTEEDDRLPYGAYTLPYNRVRRSAEGTVSQGPHLSTVGEEGAEYALLPPGSVVAPKDPNEEPTEDNAVRAIMRQLLQATESQASVPPAAEGVVVPNIPVALARYLGINSWNQLSQKLSSPKTGQFYANYLNRNWPNLFPTANIRNLIDIIGGWATASTPTVPSTVPSAPPSTPPTTPPSTPPTQPTPPPSSHPLDMNPELANIPFIKYLRGFIGATEYPGSNMPQNQEIKPINPYSPHVFFNLQKSRPGDVSMVEGYQDAFGLDPEDWKFDAAQTAAGYGLVPSGARAVFRPFFN